MSEEIVIRCTICQSTFANKPNLSRHLRFIHKTNRNSDSMSVEVVNCSSGMCSFTTKYKSDLSRHIATCPYVVVQREYEVKLQTAVNDASLYRDTVLRLQSQQAESESKIQSYREVIARLQGEKELLCQQLDKTYEQLEKANEKAHQLAEKAIDRPGTINNNTQQIGSVKITNYLADHQSYVEQTDREFIIDQAVQFFEKYLTDLINGQRALARFVVDHIIRCPETGKFILCCTDTSRKRFIYINHIDEKAEDMFAKLFLERISGPIKEVSHTIFNQIVKKLEAQKQVTNGAFERGYIDETITNITNKYLHVLEFDVDDKNSEFIVELAGLLRNPL